eukprot:757468-Hanusia_phi.AAC.1
MVEMHGDPGGGGDGLVRKQVEVRAANAPVPLQDGDDVCGMKLGYASNKLHLHADDSGLEHSLNLFRMQSL